MRATKVTLACIECNADFKVEHTMDEDCYSPRFCSFCGAEIVNEDDDLNMDSEEDDDYFD